MNRSFLFALTLGSAGLGTASFLAGSVNLQDATPGAVQYGHINVSGTIKGGLFSGNGSALTNLNASSLNQGIITLTGTSPTYMIRGSNNSGDANATGVIGLANSPTGVTYGGWFESKSSSGRALFGYASGTAGATYGIYGVASGNGGRAMFGLANNTTGNTYGGWFQANSPDGVGLYGRNPEGGIGVRAESPGTALEVLGNSTMTGTLMVGPQLSSLGLNELLRVTTTSTFSGGMAVHTGTGGVPYYGYSNGVTAQTSLAPSGDFQINNGGIWFRLSRQGTLEINSAIASTVPALSIEHPGTGPALSVTGTRTGSLLPAAAITSKGIGGSLLVTVANDTSGARAIDIANEGVGPGLFSQSDRGIAVWGISFEEGKVGVAGDSTYGEAVVGRNFGESLGGVTGRNAAPSGYGVHGYTHGANAIGVYGRQGLNGALGGSGVRGQIMTSSGTGIGVYGQATGGNQYAIFANGDHGGSGAKSFVIDHPQDPLNKILRHYCTEGSQPLNAYSGTTRTGADGRAWVTLPAYVEEINKDFRYQLTVIDDTDDFVQAKVTKELEGNRFQIRTSKPNVKVSWRVEGVRNDLHMQAHPSQDEYEKPEGWKGKYLRPELYNQPESKGIFYAPPPKVSPFSAQPMSGNPQRKKVGR